MIKLIWPTSQNKPEDLQCLRSMSFREALSNPGHPALEAYLEMASQMNGRTYGLLDKNSNHNLGLLDLEPTEVGLIGARTFLILCKDKRSDTKELPDKRFIWLKDLLSKVIEDKQFLITPNTLRVIVEEVIENGCVDYQNTSFLAACLDCPHHNIEFALTKRLQVILKNLHSIWDGIEEDRLDAHDIMICQRLSQLCERNFEVTRVGLITNEPKNKAERVREKIFSGVHPRIKQLFEHPIKSELKYQFDWEGLKTLSKAENGALIVSILEILVSIKDLQSHALHTDNDKKPAKFGFLPELMVIDWVTERWSDYQKRPANFSPRQAIEVIENLTLIYEPFNLKNKRKSFPLALGRNLARSISPDQPGATTAVKGLAKALEASSAEQAKFLKPLLDAIQQEKNSVNLGHETIKAQNLEAAIEATRKLLKEHQRETLQMYAYIRDKRWRDRQIHFFVNLPAKRDVHLKTLAHFLGTTPNALNEVIIPMKEKVSVLVDNLYIERFPRHPLAGNCFFTSSNKLKALKFSFYQHASKARVHERQASFIDELIYVCRDYEELILTCPQNENEDNNAEKRIKEIVQWNGELIKQLSALSELIKFYPSLGWSCDAFCRVEEFCKLTPGGSRPSKRWREKARELLSAEERIAVSTAMASYLKCIRPYISRNFKHFGQKTINYELSRSLKGMIWMAADFPVENVVEPLKKVAQHAYSNINTVGIRAEKIGNACVWSLAMLPNGAGREVLKELYMNEKSKKVKKRIEVVLKNEKK